MSPGNLAVQPDRPCTVSMVAAVTEVDPKKINSYIDGGVLPEDTYRKADGDRRVFAFACPIVGFYSTYAGASLTKSAKREVADSLAERIRSNWAGLFSFDGEPARDLPAVARGNRIPDGCDFDFRKESMTLELTPQVAKSLDNLMRLAVAESRIVEDPDYRGGIPTIRGTRITPYEAAGMALADGIESALEDYPSLTREDIELAILYRRAHPPLGRPKARDEEWRKDTRLVSETVVPLSGYAAKAGR